MGGHTGESGFGSEEASVAPQDGNWSICPGFLKLGPCQRLIHQRELRLDSSCGTELPRSSHPL